MLLPSPPASADLCIGRWTLRPSRDELQLDETIVKLEPRLTQVLIALADSAGEVVLTQALHERVWGRLRVTPSSIYEAIARLRQLLAMDTRTAEYITTVPRRGYRLAAPVLRADGSKSPGPRLAVLPFRVLALEPGLAALRERLLEGLIASLSRRTPCTLLARGSVLALASGDDAVARVRSVFGARYVVDGTITQRGPALQIQAELIDAERRELLWTQTLESPPRDGPDLAGPLVERLARALDMQLTAVLARESAAELAAARRQAMGSWVELFCRPQNEQSNQRAWHLSGQSLQQDRDEALGRVTRAYAGWRAATYGWQGLPRAETYAAALSDAEHALQQQPDMHDGHFTLSLLCMAVGEQGRAEEALRHSLRLVPDLAHAWGLLGWVRAARGFPRETLGLCQRALELSPLEPLRATWHWHAARAALDLGEPEPALESAQQAMAANPELAGAYLTGVMAAQQLGRSDLTARWLPWLQARPRYQTVAQLRGHYLATTPANQRHHDLMFELLHAAGLPQA